MCVLRATFLVLILHHSSEGTNHSIKWQILNPPIVFGQDVVLSCNASLAENCCTNTATWMKDFDVIVHHGASADYSKYIQKQRSDAFLLIIKNFDEDDINHQYTCLYDFFSYSEILKINRKNFKYRPTIEETKANINMWHNLIVADVIFEIVYPSPECIFVVNGEITATNVTISEETRIRLFYKMKLHLVCELNEHKCIFSVAINCTIGGDAMVVGQNSTSYCPGTTTSSFSNDESTEKTTSFSITFASVLTLCIAVVISTCVIIWRRKGNKCRTNSLHIEGGDLQSTSPVSCSNCWWIYPTIFSVESERIPLVQMHMGSVTKTTVKSINLPAQKNRDVKKLLHYLILNDESYIQKMNSDFRINAVRRSIQPKICNPSICESVPAMTSISTADILKASSVYPSWGLRKRCRVKS